MRLLFTSCIFLTLNIVAIGQHFEQKIDALLEKMTLEEKVGQMNQYNGFWNVTGPAPSGDAASNKYEQLQKGLVGSMLNVRGVDEVRKVQEIAVNNSRLGIPLIIGFDVIHGYKTISPIPLAEAASWDLEAIEKSASVAATEAAASGINWTFAPMVDISRDARWGRVMEGAGEDPYLGSLVAKARVRGFQGTDLKATNTIAACAKHFAGYGFSEGGRDYNTVDVGTATLHNQIFPPFKAAIDADVKTFMNAFNILNGIPATGNAFLQREVLKGDWKYDGFVVSDWGSIKEMREHGVSPDLRDAAKRAALAGSDMDMESYAYVNHLVELVENGHVDEALIDDAVRRILRVKFELGLMDNPYLYCDKKREKEAIGNKEHQAAVLDMALKSIVLLKNDKELLPLAKEGLDILLVGDLADDKTSPLGNWTLAADVNSAVSVLEGMKEYYPKVKYEQGGVLASGELNFTRELAINTSDDTGIEEAVQEAKGKDVVVMVLGEHGYQSGEARSRTSLDLPGLQQKLLEAVYAVNKNIVLVLMNGRPLTINWANENIPAIVEAWQLGTQSGHAIAQVLFGDYNPGGKLPMTFPKSVGQVPLYYNYFNTGRPAAEEPGYVFWSHYIDESNEPLYAFGHGLSYTTFDYSNFTLSTTEIKAGEPLKVQVTVKNTGSRAGKEVVQLYIRDHHAQIARPVKELKGFELIDLNPGEEKTVSFDIDTDMLSYYLPNGQYVWDAGIFSVMVGASSNTTFQQEFTVMD